MGGSVGCEVWGQPLRALATLLLEAQGPPVMKRRIQSARKQQSKKSFLMALTSIAVPNLKPEFLKPRALSNSLIKAKKASASERTMGPYSSSGPPNILA